MNQLKQECPLLNVWLIWLGIPVLAAAMWVLKGWWAGVIVLFAGVIAQVGYVKIFPGVSRLLGYGSVENESASVPVQAKGVSKVIVYTANVCPFCPIVKKRLAE